MLPIVDTIVGAAGKILDKVVPDAAQREQAKIELLRLQQQGEFREIELQMDAIKAEAASADPWTSRARPAFLYVFYFLLIFCGPVLGVTSAISQATAIQIAEGMKAGLAAIPEPIVTAAIVGYLGYTGARSVDKWKSGSK